MKKLLLPLSTALLILGAIGVTVMVMQKKDPGYGQVVGLPWQIETFPDGTSRVFGLRLGHSTLADAQQQLGSDRELALMVSPQGPARLEMFYSRYTAGILTGKLLISAELPAADLAAIQARAGAAKLLPSGARKLLLAREDGVVALRAVVSGVAFFPSVNLDREIALKRFGSAAETVVDGDLLTHLFYPGKGLDLVLNTQGKDVLRYVEPRKFASLKDSMTRPAADEVRDIGDADGR